MKQPLFVVRIRVEWTNADGTPGISDNVRTFPAVSHHAALNRGLRIGKAMPCYEDRNAADIAVDVGADILDKLCPCCKRSYHTQANGWNVVDHAPNCLYFATNG